MLKLIITAAIIIQTTLWTIEAVNLVTLAQQHHIQQIEQATNHTTTEDKHHES